MNRNFQPENAKRVRPNMPEYGVAADQADGMLTWDWVQSQVTKARNYWICTTRPNGRPHSVPVWAVWVEGNFFFGTERESVKARNIQQEKRVVIHLESGDETLIFEGVLCQAQESPALQSAINRAYLGKYAIDPGFGKTEALWCRLIPHKVMAWLESDYPATATYWLFEL